MIKQYIVFITFSILSFSAHAILFDRGNGLIYDNVLDITWLQDADYAKTSGYDDDGRMTWGAANEWADQLVYGGFDDWRLPSAGNPSNPEDAVSNNITGELGYMFYENLGNQSRAETSWACYTGLELCLKNTSFIDAVTGDLVSFTNIESSAAMSYWYSTFSDGSYWSFFMSTGAQDATSNFNLNRNVWAVRDGDVLAVPEPPSFLLLVAGVILIGACRMHRMKHRMSA